MLRTADFERHKVCATRLPGAERPDLAGVRVFFARHDVTNGSSGALFQSCGVVFPDISSSPFPGGADIGLYVCDPIGRVATAHPRGYPPRAIHCGKFNIQDGNLKIADFKVQGAA